MPNQVPSAPRVPGEPQGASHEVLAIGGCQPKYITADAAEQILRQALTQDFGLYSATVDGANRHVIFANVEGNGAFVFRRDSIGVVSFGGACSRTAPKRSSRGRPSSSRRKL